VVFLFLLCFIAHSYEANGGTDMEVLACFRPCFLNVYQISQKMLHGTHDILMRKKIRIEQARLKNY